MDSTSGARRMTPSTDSFRHDGAPFVRLSPHKGLKNAHIIYESIRSTSDGTLVRGDYDKRSQPMIYFPERPPKKIGVSQAIAAKNIDADRREFAAFLSSIVDAASESQHPDSPLVAATRDLKAKSNAVLTAGRDFTVGDIRESLRVISHAYKMENVRKLTSPHRAAPQQGSLIQNKRFREFIHIDRNMFGKLSNALRRDHDPKYDSTPELAVHDMKQLLRTYRLYRMSEPLPFAEFLRRQKISDPAYFFAKRWQEISLPAPTKERIQLSTEPWAKEMDKICPLLIREYRRSTRVLGGGTREANGGPSLFQPQPHSGLPPLPSAEAARSATPGSPGPSFKPLPPGTPEDERALRQLLQASPFLSSPTSNMPTASYQTADAASQGLPGPMSPLQHVSGHLIEASAHEVSAHEVSVAEAEPVKQRVVAKLAWNPVVYARGAEAPSRSTSSIASESETADPLASIMKLPPITGVAYSTIALPALEHELQAISATEVLSSTEDPQ